MVRFLRTFLAMFAVAAKRLWANRWLAIAGLLGFVAATALAFTLPLYADSVYQRILNGELTGRSSSIIPPFSFTFRYDTWRDYQKADTFMDEQAPRLIELPRRSLIRYFQTSSLKLYPSEAITSSRPGAPVAWAPLVSIGQFGDHVNLVDGQMPAPMTPPTSTSNLPYIEAIVSKPLAQALGMYVGRDYVLTSPRTPGLKIPIVISGIWEPRDWSDPYLRYYQRDVLNRMLFVNEDSFIQLAPQIRRDLFDVQWFMDFDGSQGLRVWDVQPFIDRVSRLTAGIKAEDLGVSLGITPVDLLLVYQRQSRQLATQLYAFSVPVFILVFGFIVLVAGVMANNRRAEIAVMRSRGATAWQVIGITFVEACILAALGMLLAVPASLAIAQAVGQTRSFLSFAADQMLPVIFTAAALPFGLIIVAAGIVVTVLPNLGSARLTIISYKLERARSMARPWWQRTWLDGLLLIPAAYWTYLLYRQGTVDLPGIGDQSDPFSNPSLFLLPSLAVLALTLLYIRMVPWVVRLLAWVGSRLPGTALVMAARQLARSPSTYTTPIFLLTMTLAMATFTASTAATLDSFLEQQAHYDVGGDVRLVKTGENRQEGAWGGAGQGSVPSLGTAALSLDDSGSSESNQPTEVDLGPRFTFLPISDYLKIDDVQAASRAGSYACTLKFANGNDRSCQFLGVDRADFAQVAFWRRDFARDSLGGLMNALAAAPDGVLVPESVMAEQGLQIGDLLQTRMYVEGDTRDVLYTVVGTFRLWPTWYPNQDDASVLLVGNLDHLFNEVGGQYPYDVWIKAEPGADPAGIVAGARSVDKQLRQAKDIRTEVEREQTRPQRQGLFGMLSIGFLTAALFTVLGFTLYAVFSLRRRFIELGVLRAVGLSTLQMAVFLAAEMVLLLGAGIVGGTVLGVLASRVYIPFLQAQATRALPFQVVIDWTQVYLVYVLFGLIFVVALIAMVVYVRRLRIFQAVKLGETE